MKARCVTNELAKIDSKSVRTRLEKAIHLNGPNRDISIGCDYDVHAVEFRDGGFWFFIHSIPQNDYPFPYPAEYFEVIDATIPTGWSIKCMQEGDGTVVKRLSFDEWANDDGFYERLVEGENESINVFRQRITVG